MIRRNVVRAHKHLHDLPTGPSDLRSKGRRLTRQRELIWQTLTADPDQHLSAEDVVQRVHEQLPNVNPSTVYRTLDLLVNEGMLFRTHLGADRAYYEPAHEHAHHHLVCEHCGNVSHFHDEVLGDLRQRINMTNGFTLTSSEITLHGLCHHCHAPTPS